MELIFERFRNQITAHTSQTMKIVCGDPVKRGCRFQQLEACLEAVYNRISTIFILYTYVGNNEASV